MTSFTEPPSLWRNRPFMAFWAGETVSYLGDRITALALPLIAVGTLTATATQVGVLTAAVWLPNLLSLLIGSWVDQQPHKKRALVAANLLRAVVLLSLPVAYWLGALTLGHLIAVALLSGFGQVLFSTAYPSFFVGLVRPSQYIDANSKLNTSRSAAATAGPAIGGFVTQLLGAPVAVLIDAITFFFTSVLIGRLRVDVRTAERRRSPLPSDAKEGLVHVLRDRYLRADLACVSTVNFFSFVAQALIVLFASRTLGLSAGAIGVALGVGAIGGLIGAVITPWLSRRIGVGRMIVIGSILFPAPIAAIAFADGPTWQAVSVFAAAEAVSSIGMMFFDINLNSMQTAVVPDHLRSRVAGAFGMINYGARPLGALVGGFLGTWLGLRPTLVVAAVGGALSCLWLFASPIPRLRDLEQLAGDSAAAEPAVADGAER
jgi:MFS family permease